MQDRIRLLGVRPDIWALMKAATLFVSTSAFEGQPNAVLEAMACGCPLVVSDIPAHREFLNAGNAAIVPLDRDAFIAAIHNALRQPTALAPSISAAKRTVAEQSPERIVAEYARLYETAVRRG
jgi:glycosyltransferase involved in cell wall biosynthesis